VSKLTVATCFWTPNEHSVEASRCYTTEWVDRLARSFRKHLTLPHRFVVFTDKRYAFRADPVVQYLLRSDTPDWSSMIEPFQLNTPSIIVGLDTVVTGNIDHLARYCLEAETLALPRSPGKDYACNGVCLVPAGHRRIYDEWRGENDMEWLRAQPHAFIEDVFGKGQVVSYKLHVRPFGLGDARIVYMHGRPKADELGYLDWVREHWL